MSKALHHDGVFLGFAAGGLVDGRVTRGNAT